jgi:hypothetical protein
MLLLYHVEKHSIQRLYSRQEISRESRQNTTPKTIISLHITFTGKTRRCSGAYSPVSPAVHMGCMVEKVALGHVCLRVLQFYPVNIIPPF